MMHHYIKITHHGYAFYIDVWDWIAGDEDAAIEYIKARIFKLNPAQTAKLWAQCNHCLNHDVDTILREQILTAAKKHGLGGSPEYNPTGGLIEGYNCNLWPADGDYAEETQ